MLNYFCYEIAQSSFFIDKEIDALNKINANISNQLPSFSRNTLISLISIFLFCSCKLFCDNEKHFMRNISKEKCAIIARWIVNEERENETEKKKISQLWNMHLPLHVKKNENQCIVSMLRGERKKNQH